MDRYATILIDFALGGGTGISRGDVVMLSAHDDAKPLYVALRDAVLRFDSGGMGRAFAITTGLLFTIAGFCVGKIRARYADKPISESPAAANPLP